MEEDFELVIENSIVTGYKGTLPAHLIIPEGTEAVGDFAFAQAVNLRSISLPQSIRQICQGAFHECVRLEQVEIPDQAVRIEANAFEKCLSLLTLCIPAQAAVHGDFTFYAYGQKVVDVPPYVTNIGWAFSRSNLPTSRSGRPVYTGRACNFFSCHVIRLDCRKTWNPDPGHYFEDCDRIELVDYTADQVIRCLWINGHDSKRWGKWGVHNYLEQYFSLKNGDFQLSMSNGINWYDRFVPTVSAAYDKSMAMLYRLLYPENLAESDRELFETYLKKNRKKVMQYVIDNEDTSLIDPARRLGLITKRSIDELIRYAKDKGLENMAKALGEKN